MIDFSKSAKKLFRPDTARSVPLELTPESAAAARQYVHDYWALVTRYVPKSRDTLIGLPKPYIVPSYNLQSSFDYEEMYYWDSYFIAQGLLDDEHKELAQGMLENLLYMLKVYKVIPNASRTYLMGRSQAPFLTSFIFDIYDAFKPGNVWLKKAMKAAQAEYHDVWMGIKKPNARQVHHGLSRYYDINMLHDLAEAESGWDMTPRFSRRALNYLPVDLNALLYKYETDFARAARILGDELLAKEWDVAAACRMEAMNELMWDKKRGMFYDYDYIRGKRGVINSLAAYFPMWAGMATAEQAAALVRSLRLFEFKGGLATTDAQHLFDRLHDNLPMQWAYPNGWAPLNFVVIKALQRYGYHDDARRIAEKWLRTNLNWFTAHGEFIEKYNVVNPAKPPLQGVYPNQTGFGWTNGVFEQLCREYIDNQPQ